MKQREIMQQEPGIKGRVYMYFNTSTPNSLLTVECVAGKETLFKKSYPFKQMIQAYIDYKGCVTGKILK